MDTVGAYEAKTNLAALLDRVAQGETIVIARHGVPVAKLTPVREQTTPGQVQQAIQEILASRKGRTLGDMSVRELIDEGRR